MTKFVLFLYHFWGILFGYSWPQKFFTFLRGKGLKKLPFLNPFLPKSLSKKKFESSLSRGKPVIYFPSCVERIMGKGEHLKEEKELPEVLFSILEKAGHYPIIPTKISSLCCGKLFESKGFEEASKNSLQLLEKELKILSKNGQIPIICNTTPCTKNLILGLDKNLKVYDSVQFINKFLKEDLSFIKKKKKVALHFTCSTKVLNIKEDIFGLASLCAEEITVPQDIECCGFAGDKGFFYPKLNKNALSTLKEQIPKDITAGYSQSMTCELGLTYHSNCHYRSTLYLIDESTSVELKKV
jgi:D-lactate dehydrogenase